ncbi:uncharacterized protein [Garra rufa]|uniref:uncharacterized protein n=1 Tax=Garra rufa TaxID=137080 RepID=UPI003CCE7ECD
MVFYAFFCFCLWLLSGVSDVYTDETVTISVMEGDSVTLNTDVSKIKRDDHVLWTFRINSSETRIAQTNTQSISIYDSGENERFRDRLQIDEQTGSLTITNINKLHSGLYKVQIINGGVRYKTFVIDVYGVLPVPVIIRDSSQNFSSSSGSSVSKCSLLCLVVNVSRVTLSWHKGNSLLSSISVSDLSISLSLPLEVEYQDKNTYSCVLNNPIRNQTKHLDISKVCRTSSESRQSLLLIAFLLLPLLIPVVVMWMFCHCKNYAQTKQDAQAHQEEADYTEATLILQRAPDAKANGHDVMVYSEVMLRRFSSGGSSHHQRVSSTFIIRNIIIINIPMFTAVFSGEYESCESLLVEYKDKNIYSCVLNNPISNQTQHLNITDLCQPSADCVWCCGYTEAVIRLVVSAVVGMAVVAAVVYDIRSGKVQ